ncbi:3-oxoadipate enol-lactonase [Roseobacter cerasinus]|uniref:3-oxoadipate enol-lactonase n=1 Tax=Roseobacter cerasinus TaxID=2602289 RepID=A0A640VS29_9RHOB|nr:alpha/beta fold hydrolase [Roseobacter cerasinus]GFE49705.1 3-oxoadipate enol-lactonase [Roseobacter cerasinus]
MKQGEPRFVAIDAENAIHVIHSSPEGENATFVFLNSMGASTVVWEDEIAPMLRQKGFGTLSFDYRGQGASKYGAAATLEPSEIIADIGFTLAQEHPQNPIFVGLSIGGLFAVRSWLNGAAADAMVLVNTLRKPNAQVEWINELEARLIAMGGMPLVLDVLRPVLSSCDQLEMLRPSHLPEDGYTPWPPDHPRRRLAEGVHKADWGFPWPDLNIPTLVLTGLHDRLFRIQSDVDDIMAQIPDVQSIVYPDGGHSLHAEYPSRFVDDLVAFAGSLAAKKTA